MVKMNPELIKEKSNFVESFSKLLKKYKIADVESLKYIAAGPGAEYVEVLFVGGAKTMVNVTFDSLQEIAKDVFKEICDE